MMEYTQSFHHQLVRLVARQILIEQTNYYRRNSDRQGWLPFPGVLSILCSISVGSREAKHDVDSSYIHSTIRPHNMQLSTEVDPYLYRPDVTERRP